MADIFISYKKEDAARVARIVEALRADGFSVWWDNFITPGAQWDQTIQAELAAAKAVVAIWSKASVDAPWVKEEAAQGKNRGILLPVRIDQVEPPLGFSLIQMADLVGWNGDREDPRWAGVRSALKAILTGERPATILTPRKKNRSLPPLAIWGAVGAAVLALGVLGLNWALRDVSNVTYESAARDGAVTRQISVLRGEAAPAPTSAPEATPVSAPPPVVAPSPAPPSALPSAPAPAAPDDAEVAAWDRATKANTRAAYRAYLSGYPGGFYAPQARAAVAACKVESQENWTFKQKDGSMQGATPARQPTKDAACNAARDVARANWERSCSQRTVGAGPENVRDVHRTAFFDNCDCAETPEGWSCDTVGQFTCQWNQRSVTERETCPK